LGCKKIDQRDAMVRLIRGVAGVVRIDPKRSAPGRGAWVHPRRGCLQAVKAGGLSRTFRRETRIEIDLVEGLQRLGIAVDDVGSTGTSVGNATGGSGTR